MDQSNGRAVALYWSLEFHHHADVLSPLALPAADLTQFGHHQRHA